MLATWQSASGSTGHVDSIALGIYIHTYMQLHTYTAQCIESSTVIAASAFGGSTIASRSSKRVGDIALERAGALHIAALDW